MTAKIVIVDDEVHIRSLIEQSLEDLEEDHGVEIFTAGNGADGLEIVTRERPRLVLLDVMMPKMNGYDVCEAIRRNPALCDVKVILLTAKGQEIDRTRGLSSGALQYITKPFDPDELLEAAKAILELE
ncbi:MAG: response regulator [Rhizobiaceae bacterium]|nr:response regulator [Rhizobiaceae bacterium]